ncbi:methyl-accepting chemotaxis protein [Shewanella sp. SP2S2-4]|jgi:methyl-accepting chemotaxis protein|uniref:Methyl-accepting chemotaxis sensory transducer n=3 Tax=Shewanella TaxID=22 RepID=A9L1I3_SHEB9|nr:MULTISPECIES: methyl-accepting chemotaxis protein [Shewanella]ABX50779.1 methyl-accepting chemotaxis sensory transducer [Shewanella baltica OS195]ADT95776.1 methyl-accepting chemotaxis sensory transducer with Cache sensor [Shewanella baltica OS678]EHC07826.1 methyl-accepting chemotaxis sensory transducer with Cache sensor [Shewanella baltica OS625]KZK67433.1 chemotaxis protein [Shewanella baltica]MCS6094422.1 methyl-accepting chemotaxis protein [Shewanella baltica]
MSKLSLRNKLLLLSLFPLILALLILMSVSYYVEQDALAAEVVTFKTKLVGERKQQIKEATEIAAGIVNYQLSLKEQGNVNQALRDIRFGSAGYFFMYDSQGKNIFHALIPSLEGQNKIDMTDPRGTKIIVGLLDAAKRGDGSFSYYYQKPNTNEQIEKISYAMMIPGTDWMLGTGAYIDDIDAVVEEYRATVTEQMADKSFAILLIALFLTGITGFIIMIAAHRMVVPIKNMADNLNDIAKGEGDLTKRLAVKGEDEIAQLGRSFNLFVDKLQNIIGDVATATAKVKTAANAIHAQTKVMSSQLVSHNNETDQVVTAITEMSSTASEVAKNTTQVAEATHAATGDVANAQRCVDASLEEIASLMSQINNAAGSIKSLSEQSQKINSVLSVIGGIAEQTNLLALNAAIEAARAGEQGRGFAVVADEVRNLASRTQASTLEINEMLSALHKLVTQAVKAMEESQQSCVRSVDSSRTISDSLGSVTSAVTAINDMSTQIAAAATEQSSVTEEINRNVYAIQEIVNELLHSSEDAARVSLTVSEEGINLGKLVGQFRI